MMQDFVNIKQSYNWIIRLFIKVELVLQRPTRSVGSKFSVLSRVTFRCKPHRGRNMVQNEVLDL